MVRKYEGKYVRMAEQFRADGVDEDMIEKFIGQEMEADEAKSKEGIIDLKAESQWRALSDAERHMLLTTAFCRNCGLAEFAPAYSVRRDKFGLVVEGVCSKCGAKIARMRSDV